MGTDVEVSFARPVGKAGPFISDGEVHVIRAPVFGTAGGEVADNLFALGVEGGDGGFVGVEEVDVEDGDGGGLDCAGVVWDGACEDHLVGCADCWLPDCFC